MLKKFLVTCIITIFSFGLVATPAYAYGAYDDVDKYDGSGGGSSGSSDSNNQNNTQTSSNCERFLGMVPWNCGINIEEIKGEDQLKSKIWLIALNVAEDIAILAAYLVVAYVVYGGYLYMFSGGEGGKVATGKKTLIHAFTGLAIVMSADLIMSTIRFVILGNEKLSGCESKQCVEPDDLFIGALNWFITVSGIVAVIFLIYGGFLYITSTGDPGKIKKAKDTIMYSLIGLAIVALAATITAIVSSAIRDASTASFINQTLILKGDL